MANKAEIRDPAPAWRDKLAAQDEERQYKEMAA